MTQVSVRRKPNFFESPHQLFELLQTFTQLASLLWQHDDLNVVFKINQNDESLVILHENSSTNRVVIINPSSVMNLIPFDVDRMNGQKFHIFGRK
jgi:hypothetical protein